MSRITISTRTEKHLRGCTRTKRLRPRQLQRSRDSCLKGQVGRHLLAETFKVSDDAWRIAQVGMRKPRATTHSSSTQLALFQMPQTEFPMWQIMLHTAMLSKSVISWKVDKIMMHETRHRLRWLKKDSKKMTIKISSPKTTQLPRRWSTQCFCSSQGTLQKTSKIRRLHNQIDL